MSFFFLCRIYYFDYSLKSWYTLIFFYITMFLDILIAINLEKKENSLDVILLNNVHKCFFLFLLKVIKHKWLGFVLVFSCLFFVKCPFWYAVWLDKHNCSASLIYNSILMWSLLAARYIYFQIMLLYPSLIFYSATRKLCIIISIRWHFKKSCICIILFIFCLFGKSKKNIIPLSFISIWKIWNFCFLYGRHTHFGILVDDLLACVRVEYWYITIAYFCSESG